MDGQTVPTLSADKFLAVWFVPRPELVSVFYPGEKLQLNLENELFECNYIEKYKLTDV